MHRWFSLGCGLLLAISGHGCAKETTEQPPVLQTEQVEMAEERAQEGEAQGTKGEEDAQVEQLELQIGTEVYQVRLAQTETAQTFAAKLPLTLSMNELNGNEKYGYLEEALPTKAERVGQIESGDLMLYGEDCVVLFYDSFSTNDSYTPLGRVEDTTGLKEAVGEGAVTITVQEKG